MAATEAAGPDFTGADARARLTEVARQALSHYDVAADCTVALLDLSENATFRIDDPALGTCSVLRVHRLNYHRPEAINSELRWMEALRRDAGIRTPRVLPTASGEPLVQVRPADGGPVRTAVRFEFLPGAPPEESSLRSDFESLGEITARMHRHARSWPRPAGFTRFRWDLDAAFGPAARWGTWRDGIGLGATEAAVLERLASTVSRRLAAFGAESDRWGLIHADLRLANLLVDESGGVSVIDFDDCGLGWFLYDLATATSFFEHRPEVPELIDRWLAGYRTVLPVTGAQEAEIWTLILLRRLFLVAWVASHQGSEFARDLGAQYTRDSCDLAERYLASHS